MIAKSACGLTVCLLWSLLIVCSAKAETFRGQSPTAYAARRPVPIQPLKAAYPPGYHIRGVRRVGSHQQKHPRPVRHASASIQQMPMQQMPVRHYNQANQHGTVVYGESLAGSCCGTHQCGHCACCSRGRTYEPGWRPTHRHFSTYDPPNNLVYPPAQVPAGFVQYPYYTTRGPTDFFYGSTTR